MERITHPLYRDYPEQPYISPERDLAAWQAEPEKFPYGVVAKKQMQRLPEGVLPGDVVMLWRIHFGTFTTESVIPQYFEYRYGVESNESLATLLRLGYARLCTAAESLPQLSLPVLKRILRANGLAIKGKKDDLLARLRENLPEEKLAAAFSLRQYAITEAGGKLLDKYDAIIQQHGPKMG